MVGSTNGQQQSNGSSGFVNESTVPSVLENKVWSGLSSTYDLNDPHTGELLYKVSSVTTDDCLKAVESAEKAFKTWKNTSPFTKRAIFIKAADLLQERKEEFVKLTVQETTGNEFWGAVDHQLAWNIVAETAALATALKGEIVPTEDGSRAYVERVPYGVVFGIAPWNAPLTLGVRAFCNAIMAGNTCVFKTSEYSPKIHTFATQLFVDAGLPEGVLNMVHVSPKDAAAVCEKIIAHPAVRKVNFTGSTFVGAKIAEVCGRHIKPVCLELGGKAPVIVMKDANLKAAANSVMFGGLSHSGQICMSSDSLIVHEDVADEFTKILSEMLSSRKASAKADGPMGYRGLFSRNSADRVTALVKDATDKGAKVIIGSAKTEKNVVQPVIVEGTTPEMRLYSEEIFGPALTFNRFSKIEEAIERANASDYGLAASVYGSDEGACMAVAKEIESGQVHINGSTVHDAQVVPHGGLKKSGYGRFNGLEGLREFSTTKTITVNFPHDSFEGGIFAIRALYISLATQPYINSAYILDEYIGDLDKTSLGDQITELVFLPIVTMEGILRGIAIVGLNPRRAWSSDYQVFLDLLMAQLSNGLTGIRLVNEELRRSRFFAHLIKRKNEELSSLLEARTNELRSSELKFLKMTEISPVGIWSATPDGDITFANDSWWTLSGHPRERGANTYLESVHEDDMEKSIQAWHACLNSKTSIPPMEFRFKKKPGEINDRWCQAISTPELGPKGEVIAVTGAIMDITSKKLMELYQEQRADEAIELRRQQERFIDVISHEMRNPLSAISLSTDASMERVQTMLSKAYSAEFVAADFSEDMNQTVQDLGTVSHCCDHLRRLVDDVLLLSKIDNDFLVVTPVPTLLTESIRKTLAMFTSELISKRITCAIEVTSAFAKLKVDWLSTDPSRVSQLLINLLTNAIKFTAQSEVRHITVKVDCSASRPYLEGVPPDPPENTSNNSSKKPVSAPTSVTPISEEQIFYIVSVSDTGRGISPEELKRLFQRFHQASEKTHITYGGSGLGLFICRRLAMLFGGEIGVVSERGKGSTFTFYISTRRCLPIAGEDGHIPAAGTYTVTGSAPEIAQPMPGAPKKQKSTSSTASSSSSSNIPKVPPEKPILGSESLHVLIVEDNLINQQLLARHLKRSGCVTSTSNNGQEAIDTLKTSSWVVPDGRRIDVVLMDIEMPVLDGLSAIKILREMQAKQEVRGHLPVLAVTANARQEQVDAMKLAGFDGTISKPFKIPVILDRMKTLLASLQWSDK